MYIYIYILPIQWRYQCSGDPYDRDKRQVVARRSQAPFLRERQVDRLGRSELGAGRLLLGAGGGDGERGRGSEVRAARAVLGFGYLRDHAVLGGVELARAAHDFSEAV